jgi:hypothetical protein
MYSICVAYARSSIVAIAVLITQEVVSVVVA